MAAYEAAHPNVKIKTVLQSTDNLMPNFAAAAKAKKGPDIEYRWGGIWALQDAWDGNLAAVSDYIPKSEWQHYLNGVRGYVREQAVDGPVVRAAVVPGAVPQGHAREVRRRAPTKPGISS